MRKSLALFALALAAGQAWVGQSWAADLRFPAGPGYYPPPSPPPGFYPGPRWTGCYAGLNLGGAWANINETSAGGSSVVAHPASVAGGGQVGCDVQFDAWVFGVRDMIDATRLRSSTTFPLGGSANSRTNWYDTLTAREGYLVQPSVLLYVHGGAAWTSTSLTVFAPSGAQIGSLSSSSQGWTLGGGGEWMFAPHWSAFLEGNYMDFGSQNRVLFDGGVCAAGCAFNTSTTASNILVGVNYRFGGFGKAPY
jgi:outer membrane immunogenic protein